MLGTIGSLSKLQIAVLSLLALIVTTTGIAAVIYFFPTASNQGYMPEQPIPFSHRLHAGELEISCRYCHTSAYKTRHASVPAMNVCMNCHQVVKTDSPHIQKLTDHYNRGEPVEWVRIHELPDFSFFNHRPHVAAGVSCEECHGDISSMDRVYQAKPLTMGWCKDCHEGQTTPSNVLRSKHPDLEDPRGHHVAPLNCSTCHY